VCNRTLIGHVSLDGETAGLAGDLCQPFDAAVEQLQRRSFRGEEQCAPPPYAGRCTGN
jgi:hypothetical protein